MDALAIVGIIAAVVGIVAGIVQVVEYLQKRRGKSDERPPRPGFTGREPEEAQDRVKVYVSSIHTDLDEQRQRVVERLRQRRYAVLPAEAHGATDDRPLDRCLADVASCDTYVGIFAWRYGTVPPGEERSIAELEYRQAGDSGLERLIFLLDEDAAWPQSKKERGPGREKIEALRKELTAAHPVKFFRDADDLAGQVVASVDAWARARLAADMDRLRARRDRADGARRELRERQRVVNLRPLDVTHTFKDRVREMQALCDCLSDRSVRLVSVVGRGGMGKTALACRVLADLERRAEIPEARQAPPQAPAQQAPHAVGGQVTAHPVNGILYLSARSTGLGLERIYTDVGRMLGQPAARRLAARWADRDTPLAAKAEYLLEAMQDGLYLILLDNLEDCLAEDGTIAEEGLRLFVERCLTQPSGARLIVTSREEVKIVAAALHGARCIPLREGLPEDDAVALLRDLDPQGTLGLCDAPEGDLRRAARLAQGIPRALEILAGILHKDPTASLSRLLANGDLFGEQVVEQLVAEGYRRLGEGERRIMEALAVFDRPVDETAVAFLLHPWFPGLDVRAGLRHLVRGYFASVNRVTGEYSLHPLDREHAYRQIPDQMGIEIEIERGEGYTRRNLELRAADFYASIRKPESEWKTIDDLAPQLAEFEHRVRAGDYGRACRVLEPIDLDYLFLWGHYARLVQLREKLVDHLTDRGLRAANLDRLGLAYHYLGQLEQAIELHKEALAIACEIDDRRAEGDSLGNLGLAHHHMGQSEQAIELYKQALTIAREIGDRREEGTLLDRLGRAHRALGQVERAIESHEEALAIAREVSDRQQNEDGCLGRLGVAHRMVGHIDRAIELFNESLTIAREIGNRTGEARHRGDLGSAYRDLGQIERAIEFHERALATAREIGHRREESIWLSSLGLDYSALGQSEHAIKHYKKALRIAREIGDRRGESHQLLRLGQALLAMGELSEAQRHCAEAVALDVLVTSYRAALALGIVLLHQRDPAARETFMDTAARCRALLDKTAGLYAPRYALAAALVGQAVCDPRWAEENAGADLLAPALAEYRRALETCAAPGVVRDARWHLEMVRAAGIEGLGPMFELLDSALEIREGNECHSRSRPSPARGRAGVGVGISHTNTGRTHASSC
jgi:tetratricopeptide (TPR) repeat protein